VWNCVVLQKLRVNTLYLTRFRTYKIASPSQTRPGLIQNKHLPQNPFPGNIFLDDDILDCFLSV
jgi:hypothetical protein